MQVDSTGARQLHTQVFELTGLFEYSHQLDQAVASTPPVAEAFVDTALAE